MFTVVKRDAESEEKRGKEAIHSGHFMVSHFEAEEQDDEYELAVPIPEPEITTFRDVPIGIEVQDIVCRKMFSQQPLTIDTSLSKLFQCMSIAYRQKLTSPKWNRFRGIRLRWKDKIRLNNVIWRCWHMQFIKKVNTDICQFASPLDVDTHNKPEAIVLEGKYWKRKLAAVTAEYKKWRMFHRHHILGHAKDTMEALSDLDTFAWHSQSSDHMMVDEDYLGLMSDTLFSSIASQPFVFPDSREIARAGLADFIQPSLGPLQPNLDDYMDTFEPLQEFISCKLPTVPEENGEWNRQQNINWCYTDLDLMNTNSNIQINSLSSQQPAAIEQYNPVQSVPVEKQVPIHDTGPQLSNYSNDMMIHPVEVFLPQQQTPQTSSVYQSPVISKSNKGSKKINHTSLPPQRGGGGGSIFIKSSDTMYQNYTLPDICAAENRIQLPIQQQTFKLPQPSEPVNQQTSRGYKFSAPASVAPNNLKFTSQTSSGNYKAASRPQATTLPTMNSTVDNALQEVKIENRVRSAHRSNRQRSISMSREPIKRPPLISAMSDPSLVTPANSVLLTQLLTNNPQSNMFSQSLGTLGPTSDLSSSNSVRIKEENLTLIPPPAQATALIITTPVTMNTSQSSINDALLLTSLGASNSSSPSSSRGVGSSPTSPQGALGSPTRGDSSHKDQRRVGHIHAEQKRRYNIKNGFDVIHSLIPHLNQNPNAKLSKAAMLQKGAEYIRQLQQERSQLKDEMDSLRQQIEALNTSISNCQSLLPTTGAPVSRRRDSKMQDLFDEYVKKRTMEDWKFWIFSLLVRPLLNSFNNFVSTSSLEDLYRSTLHWVEQHCTLVDLRPVVLNSLRYLCTKTDILSEPEKLPEEARQAVMSLPPSSSNQTQL